MFAYHNKFGITVVSPELPEGVSAFVTFEDFPAEGGVPLLLDGELHFVAPTPPPEKKGDPVEQLQAENRLLKAQLQAQSDRADFVEDCIAEMAMVVYGGV